MEIYVIPNYKIGDEVEYLNYVDAPVKIRVDGRDEDNKPLLLPHVGTKYKSKAKKKLMELAFRYP